MTVALDRLGGDCMAQTQTMLGKRFGRLTVIEFAGVSRTRKSMWICKCDCGAVTSPIPGYRLRGGSTQSCGCLKVEKLIERSTKHSKCFTRLYRIWAGMKDRCYNPGATKYHRYGARGIKVCDEWLNDFQVFHDWALSNGYGENLTIDRIDNDGNYCPQNCRWATNEEQCNNREHHILLTIGGETKTIAQWAKDTGLKYRTIHARYNRGCTGESLIRKV